MSHSMTTPSFGKAQGQGGGNHFHFPAIPSPPPRAARKDSVASVGMNGGEDSPHAGLQHLPKGALCGCGLECRGSVHKNRNKGNRMKSVMGLIGGTEPHFKIYA